MLPARSSQDCDQLITPNAISTDQKSRVFYAEALTKTYSSGEIKVEALRGIDLEIWPEEVIVLLGPSGSGKSTLLNIMGGLDHATSGRLWFNDLELTSLDDRGLTAYRRRHVGFIFQFYNLIPSLTAFENVALVTEIAEHPMHPDEALTLVGLDERKDHSLLSYQAASSSGSRLRAQSPSAPRCCFATNRPEHSTLGPVLGCSMRYSASIPNSGRRR